MSVSDSAKQSPVAKEALSAQLIRAMATRLRGKRQMDGQKESVPLQTVRSGSRGKIAGRARVPPSAIIPEGTSSAAWRLAIFPLSFTIPGSIRFRLANISAPVSAPITTHAQVVA
jgi:hypothetical protein